MNKYVVTYSQGGAVNQKYSVFAVSEADARRIFREKYDKVTVTDVQLVMRGGQ